jgi:hypothetical protein
MGKWLNKTLKPTDSPESQNHADIEDLARLVEGTLDSAERKHLLDHLSRCRKCYEILQETLTDVSNKTSGRRTTTAWWKRKSVYALAASILIVFIIGGQLVYKFRTQHSPVVSAELSLNQELKDILLENNALHWESLDRIQRLISVLHKKGIQIKQFNRVVLSKPYYQKKSLFGPEENLHIRIEGAVAYLEVKEVP